MEDEKKSGIGKILVVILAVAGVASAAGVLSKVAKTAKTARIINKAQDAQYAAKVVPKVERESPPKKAIDYTSNGYTVVDYANQINTANERQKKQENENN